MPLAPRSICLSALIALVCGLWWTPTSSAAPAADWPNFRGPGGNGVSAEAGLPTTWSATENIAWKTDLPGPGASSPVVIGDRIYLTSYTGAEGGDISGLARHLLCLNRADGKVRWTKQVAAKQPEQAKIREGHGWATNTPSADDKAVYVFMGKTGVFAFDHDGKQLWQVNVGDQIHNWGSATSPVLYKNLVIINASVESNTMYALDRATGKEVWRAGNIKESWNTPILAANSAGKTELIVAVFKKILAFDPDTGKPLWNCDTDINWYMAPSMVATGGVVYALGGRSGTAGLAVKLGGSGDVTASHRLWTSPKGSNVSSPVYHDGHLYWMNDNNETAYCADPKTGKVIYEERVSRAGQVYGSALLADGKIYYPTRTGKILVVAAKPKFELLATNEVESRGTSDATPAVAGGRLYVRTNKALYCIGKK